jgi:hypothetical protein
MYLFSVGQMAKGPPRRGLRTQPRISTGFNPGNQPIKRFALKLTRRYAVAPSMKNTRSSGLEMLKEREERAMDILQRHPAFVCLVRSIRRPFRARRLGSVPRVETLG